MNKNRLQVSSLGNCSPRTNVIDFPDRYVIEMECSGYSKNTLYVRFKDNRLTVIGHKDLKLLRSENIEYLLHELKSGRFKKTFNLGDNIDPTGIYVKLNDDILHIDIPKLVIEDWLNATNYIIH